MLTVEEWLEELRKRSHTHGDTLSRHEGEMLAEAIRREAVEQIVGQHHASISALQKFCWSLGGVGVGLAIVAPVVFDRLTQ